MSADLEMLVREWFIKCAMELQITVSQMRGPGL